MGDCIPCAIHVPQNLSCCWIPTDDTHFSVSYTHRFQLSHMTHVNSYLLKPSVKSQCGRGFGIQERSEAGGPRGGVKDVMASAPPSAACRPSGSAGGPMSYEGAAAFKNLEELRSPEKGVWRVRVAISSELLAEILSEQANTEAIIKRMRTYAASTAGAT
ncbi:hypothetical protein BHM03_00029745 [Ensete ventricosum]|uniref:Uncharacterized protein n=1 Tax=Ensete ventricosum TaxID=4639 RepID=A0A445MI90_ENSVE|nr:hypothetical protein BHM03_00029745 [Ensete ventricosum]